MSTLPPCPSTLTDAGGAPRYGTWEGGLEVVRFDDLKGAYAPGRLEKFKSHKKWLYGFIATREVATFFAVVDVNYSSNAFAMAVDLTTNEVLANDGFLGPPRPMTKVSDHPGPGLDVAFRRPDATFTASRPFGDERFHVSTRMGLPRVLKGRTLEADWSLLAAGAAPALTVIAPVEGGIVNVTQKWAGLLGFGRLRAGGKTFNLDGGVGGLDSTFGLLARRTAWRWAFACGRLDDGTPLGINLVEGFNEARDDVNENAVWLGRELIPLGRARFTWNRSDVLDRWSVTTIDGKLELEFRPIAAHLEHRDLKLVVSRFAQPVGRWSGVFRHGGREYRLVDVPGVAEDQDVTW
ncbi:MAG: DUF2804 domain-containing protein [Myxococcales bacterium]|nr:DUF2804 domain-containing protein [Myxococcales bacterium]